MKRKSIKYSPKFFKSLRKLPKDQVKLLDSKQQALLEDPFDPKLKTHKLQGKLSEFYACSISYHWRIVFHFESDGDIVLDTVGTHEVYQ